MGEDFQLRKLDQVKNFRGKFTGKIVKPVNEEENLQKLKDFENGNLVWVLMASDFSDFLLTMHGILELRIESHLDISLIPFLQ